MAQEGAIFENVLPLPKKRVTLQKDRDELKEYLLERRRALLAEVRYIERKYGLPCSCKNSPRSS